MVLQLNPIVLPIWDFERSIAFYRDALGPKLIDVHDGDDWEGCVLLMLAFALSDKRERKREICWRISQASSATAQQIRQRAAAHARAMKWAKANG